MERQVNRLTPLLVIISCFAAPARALEAASAPADDDAVYLFTSFRGSGDGLHYAWSEDAKDWTDIPGVFLDPDIGAGLLRDPDIEQGPDGTYHLVWTTGWSDDGIGYAHSTNLRDWSPPRYLPFMADTPGTRNSWAPELYYDDPAHGGTGDFLITWSSDVEGRFPGTKSNDRMNNRTYYVTTTDFQEFTEPEVLVDPGFDHIDWSMTHIENSQGDTYVAVIKEGDMQARGVWGPVHRLEAPKATGPWKLVGDPIITERAEGPALAFAPGPDGDQTILYVDFYTGGHYGAYATTDWKTWTNISDQVTTVDGQRHGSITRVPRSLVESLIEGPALEPATITIDAAAPGKPISPNLVGVFFEDINHAADGGLYAELVRNRSFEFNATDRADWNALTAWTLDPRGGAAWHGITDSEPLHPNNPHYIGLHATDVKEPGPGLVNTGFDGIPVEAGKSYRFAVHARQLYMGGRWDGDNDITNRPMPATARLETKHGDPIGEATIEITGRDWRRYETTITATHTDPDARFAIRLDERGGVNLDMISLFPADTFKGRENGLRKDLAQTIADLSPAFVRFPGGCLVHGDGLNNMYRWENTVGPVETRKGQRNIWRYHQSAGLGYHEYFQFCEDIGAEPLPVVPAGVCCQNSHQTGGIGQRGIPMELMPDYVESVLNLIEWANGPADSEWGRVRAEAGHPEPFDLKYLGIGNEDRITPVFRERFAMIHDAVKKAHPEITLIGTTGPFHSGEDYDAGWTIAREMNVDMVDEHYYVPPDWFWENLNRYDAYSRDESHVYLGEYAAHDHRRQTTMRSALAEAAYLTALERNADIVEMASYAPMLAKAGNTQWNPDLIYFTNTEIAPTINYYVQQLFGVFQGDTLLPTESTLDQNADTRFAFSAVRDAESGDTIIKIVNGNTTRRPLTINLEGLSEPTTATLHTLAHHDPMATNTLDHPDTALPTTTQLTIAPTFTHTAPANSLTVLHIPGR